MTIGNILMEASVKANEVAPSFANDISNMMEDISNLPTEAKVIFGVLLGGLAICYGVMFVTCLCYPTESPDHRDAYSIYHPSDE